MKIKYFLGIIYIFMLAACNLQEVTKHFVPGTYATTFKDSDSFVEDTFYIHVLTSSGSDQFAIINKVLYQQTVDGIVQPVESKTHKWSGSYDRNHKTIVVNQTGAILAFDPAKQEMKLGTTTYKKVKP